MTVPGIPLELRLLERIELTDDGCWLWTGARNGDGYGNIRIGGRRGQTLGAHRIAYETFVGPIPAGLTIDHLCRVRPCINPSHLEAVTGRENTLRGETLAAAEAARTHCPQGHPYSGANLFVGPDGLRRCRVCRRVQSRAYKARRRAAAAGVK